MRRSSIFASAMLGAFASLFIANQARAQIFNNPARSYGVGADNTVSPYRGLFGNKHGTAATTDGTVTGTFGGPDHRFVQKPPLFGMGLGWWGYRSPSPRPNANFTYNAGVGISTAEPPLADAPDEPAAPASPDMGTLTVEVRVPIESAQVFVNGQATRQGGMVRTFASPSLAKGESYEYDIRAEWTANGKKVSRTQSVSGKPGERVVADFGN
jgi:uncharacterized protein (TIGR03000 family)